MNLFTQGKNLHHAYCIVGDTDKIISELEKFFKKEFKFSFQGNPDFWFAKFDTLNVESSRMIKETHFQKSVVGESRVSIISTNFITEQAQNAMLKMFEEPALGTYFFLISPTALNLLPTLKSRMIFVDANEEGKAERKANKNSLDAKEFLFATVGERMKKIKKLLDAISDEKESKIEAVNFLNTLEVEIHRHTKMSKATERELFILEEIEKCRSYASDPSPSIKTLLEHLALIV